MRTRHSQAGLAEPRFRESEILAIAISDQTTAITTGEKFAMDMPHDFVVTRVYGSLKTAPAGSAFTVDVEDEGTTILNAVLSISAGTNNAETSTFASSAASYRFDKGDLLSIDVDAVGSGTAGAGCVISIFGYRP